MNSDTVNIYLQAYGMLCLGLVPYLLIKLYLVSGESDKYYSWWESAVNSNDKLRIANSKFHSKRDAHKQERASWVKQKAKLIKKIKELEEK